MAETKEEVIDEPQGGEDQKENQDPQGGTDPNAEKMKQLEDELGKWQHLAEKYKKEAGDYRVSKKEIEDEVEKLKGEIQSTKTESDITKEALKQGADPDLTLAYIQRNKVEGTPEEIVTQALKDKPNLKSGKAVATGDTGRESEGKTDLNSWIHGIAQRGK